MSGSPITQPPETYERMGFIHFGMWSDPSKNTGILLAAQYSCLGGLKFGARSWSTNGGTAPNSGRSSASITAIRSFWKNSAKFIRSITYQPHHQRSEEHTSELQSHSGISYAVFCL